MRLSSRCTIALLGLGVLGALGWRWFNGGRGEDRGILEQFRSRGPALVESSRLGSALSSPAAEPAGSGAVLRYGDQPLALSEWVAAGYFNAVDDAEALATDYVGLRDQADARGFTLERALAEPQSYPQLRIIRRVEMSENVNPFAVFSLNKASGIAPTFYVEAKVYAERAKEAILLLGSDGLVTTWLNAREIGGPGKRREFLAETYNAQVPVKLAAGVNRLLFKVSRCQKSCGIVAALVPDSHQALCTLLEKNRSFLQSLLLPEGAPLAIELRGAPDETTLDLAIEDCNHTLVARFQSEATGTKWEAPQPLLPGLYYASASLATCDRREAFVVGDPEKQIREKMDTLERGGGPQDAANLRAIGRRASILLDAANRKPEDREWQRKVVYTIEELEESVARQRKQQPRWKNLPGLHLRGFRSALDGGERHYRIFVPRQYDPRRPLPLAIIAPTALSASRPFLESAFVAAHLDAECLSEVAEELGVGVLWPGYPALPFGNPCEFLHLDEVLEAVAADYAIDTRRIYWLGTCHGATIATMMAQNWPRRFAALGLLNPTVARERNYGRDERKYQSFRAYKEWITANDPINHLQDIPDVPIHVVFDHGDPEHGSLSEAEGFVASARAAHLSPTFEHVTSSLSRINGWKRLLAQVSGDVRREVSPQISAWRARMARRVGPVARGFSPSFVVIQGTLGSESERAANARILRQLADSWRAVFYAECPIELDVKVEEATLRDRNMVLIGNAHTNAVWQAIEPHLRLRVKSDGIAVGARRYEGGDIAIQAIVRSPLNPERRCVLIGAHDLAKAQFGTMDLAVDGWFDYAIWQAKENGSCELLVAERYSDR